jgi:hypothetical protein
MTHPERPARVMSGLPRVVAAACLLICALPDAAPGKAPATKEQDGDAKPRSQVDSATQCGGKSTCKQMTSCAEARFYFSTCGIDRLDRDNDGIPCESLCKPKR